MSVDSVFDDAIPLTALVLGVSLSVALVVTAVRGPTRSTDSAEAASVCPHCGKEVRLVVP